MLHSSEDSWQANESEKRDMPLRSGSPLPELSGATEWVNGEVSSTELAGTPVLVHFWAKSCPICHDNMPQVGEWRDQYAASGLKVIAIHMPREDADTNVEAVHADLNSMGMTEPCAIDNQHTIGDRFENQLWPAYYIFDGEGNMRGRAGGYAGLKMIEAPLKRVLGIDQV